MNLRLFKRRSGDDQLGPASRDNGFSLVEVVVTIALIGILLGVNLVIAAGEGDAEIAAVLSADKIAEAFSLARQLRNVDQIFERVFGVK